MTQPSQLDLTCGKKILLVFKKSHLALIKFTLIDALFISEMVKKLKKGLTSDFLCQIVFIVLS